ncbi:MAG TPA: translation initiation factor [Saprospiraceae bacterium]|nr:translation initiation factor [Saprospiraceae bacterium]HQW55386.1 translation initiation factor [Saprospiraceae bacterium]
MKNKAKASKGGIVYSTDPDYNFPLGEEFQSLDINEIKVMPLRVWVDKKNRGGKEATIIRGFSGHTTELETLGKTLKTKCGVGGAAKDGEIILQGNHRDKVVKWLHEMGYIGAKSAGG